jgi:hypothetical protein
VFSPITPNLPFVLINRKGYAIMLSYTEIFERSFDWPFDYIVYQNDYFVSDVYSYLPDIGKFIKPIDSDGKTTLAIRNSDGIDCGLKDLIAFNKKIIFNSSAPPGISWSGMNGPAENYFVGTETEFGPCFRDTFSSGNELHFISSGYYFTSNKNTEAKLVLSVDSAGKNNFYFSYDLKDFMKKENVFNNVSVMYTLSNTDLKGKIVSWYLWNVGKDSIQYKKLRVDYY